MQRGTVLRVVGAVLLVVYLGFGMGGGCDDSDPEFLLLFPPESDGGGIVTTNGNFVQFVPVVPDWPIPVPTNRF